MRWTLAAMTLGIGYGQVYLNHFYATVDPETYSAIENSSFIRNTFAVFEQRTTIREDRTYTGIYLYGDHNYFEFFEAGKDQSPTPVGVAFGVEESGALSRLAAAWKAQGLDPALLTLTRHLDGAAIPWFLSLSPASEHPAVVRMWMMEYLPEFLTRWHSEVPTPSGISRGDVLARYRAFLRKDQKLMADVTRISIQVPGGEDQSLKKLAGLMGCRIENREIVAADARIRLVPPLDSRTGVRQIVMRLRRAPSEARRFTLGASVLELLPDGRAVWNLPGTQ
ncbi:MAG: hypothetical protein IT161_02725 [Bryobacterales bacterium]|nr:hypothetical protein [Bryobacterales bacterium]